MKLFLKIIMWLLIAAVAFFAFVQLLGLFTILAYVLALVVVVGAILYFCFPGLFGKREQFLKEAAETKPKLLASAGTVTGFIDKPTVQQLAHQDTSKSVTLNIDGDADVKVLEDDGDLVIKIKVLAGQEKGSVA